MGLNEKNSRSRIKIILKICWKWRRTKVFEKNVHLVHPSTHLHCSFLLSGFFDFISNLLSNKRGNGMFAVNSGFTALSLHNKSRDKMKCTLLLILIGLEPGWLLCHYHTLMYNRRKLIWAFNSARNKFDVVKTILIW